MKRIGLRVEVVPHGRTLPVAAEAPGQMPQVVEEVPVRTLPAAAGAIGKTLEINPGAGTGLPGRLIQLAEKQ